MKIIYILDDSNDFIMNHKIRNRIVFILFYNVSKVWDPHYFIQQKREC